MKAIQYLIKEGEGQNLDFKHAINSSQKIAKTLVAFANSTGGTLLIGVKDNGRIKGIIPDEERHMILQAAQRFCKPIIDVSFEETEIDQKIILKADIKESDEKPHFALGEDEKWWAYVRIEDEVRLASKIMLEVMKKARTGKGVKILYGKPETTILKYLSQENSITLKEYCSLAKIPRWKAMRIITNLILSDVIAIDTAGDFDKFVLKNIPSGISIEGVQF